MKRFNWIIILCGSLTLAGCQAPSHELPERMSIPVPSKSWDGAQWQVEADKITSEFNQLYNGESSNRKSYKVGDNIRIQGHDYKLESIESDDKPRRVWLKRAE